MNDLTRLLNTPGDDETGALASSELLSLVYDELRRVAAARMAFESPGQTLQPTALVHEAWLRIAGNKERPWNDRTHFFATAAEAMRLILVENARRKRAKRHGGGQQRVEMPDLRSAEVEDHDRVLAVNDALEKLAELAPAKAEVVKMRYFVGMTIEEAADAMGISARTAKRYWTFARAWLREEIKRQAE